MKSKFIRTALLTGVLCSTISSVASASSNVTLGKPKSGIIVSESVQKNEVLVEALITEGLSDITVTDDNIDEITEAYKDLTKLPVTEVQRETAKKEYELAKDILKTQRVDQTNLAKFLAECKLNSLQDKFNIDQLKMKYGIDLSNEQMNSLKEILENFQSFRYSSNAIVSLLSEQVKDQEHPVINFIKSLINIGQ